MKEIILFYDINNEYKKIYNDFFKFAEKLGYDIKITDVKKYKDNCDKLINDDIKKYLVEFLGKRNWHKNGHLDINRECYKEILNKIDQTMAIEFSGVKFISNSKEFISNIEDSLDNNIKRVLSLFGE